MKFVVFLTGHVSQFWYELFECDMFQQSMCLVSSLAIWRGRSSLHACRDLHEYATSDWNCFMFLLVMLYFPGFKSVLNVWNATGQKVLCSVLYFAVWRGFCIMQGECTCPCYCKVLLQWRAKHISLFFTEQLPQAICLQAEHEDKTFQGDVRAAKAPVVLPCTSL